MSISFSGLASGIDTSSWVQALVSLKRAKIKTLEEQKNDYQLSFDTLNNIKSFFTSFRSLLEKVTDTKFSVDTMDIFTQKLATSTAPNKVAVSATASAEENEYEIEVKRLATLTKVKSGKFESKNSEVEVRADLNTKLSDLGVKNGKINLYNGTSLNITSDTTIQDFVSSVNQDNNKSKYFQKFDFDENLGRFSYIFLDSSLTIKNDVIHDPDNTQIVDKLGLNAVITSASEVGGGGYPASGTGYSSGILQYEVVEPGTTTETPITVTATGATKLSQLGVSSGDVKIYSYNGGNQTVNVSSDWTINDLLGKLPGATFSNGVLKLSGVKITDDGTTSLKSALSLTETTTGSAKTYQSPSLYYTTSGSFGVSIPAGAGAEFVEPVTRRDTSSMTALSGVSETKAIYSGQYSISSVSELQKLATMANNGKISGGEFVLANDIDLSSVSNWTPIGNGSTYSNVMVGIFDGNGYKISNLKINSSEKYVGLFGYSRATIKNLGLENVDITATKSSSDVGGLVGQSTVTIENCYVSGSITATKGSGNVGGLAGYSADITNCNVTGSITSDSSSNTGGLVGRFLGSNIKNSNIYSTITALSSYQSPSSNYVSGGAVGYAGNDITLTNVNVLASDSSKMSTRFVGNAKAACTIVNSKYNKKFSSLYDYVQCDYKGYVATSTQVTSVPTAPTGLLQAVTKRDTSSMTALSSVSETTTISDGTYSISSAYELEQLATMTNSGRVTGGEFVLANDINLSSISNWTQIGKDALNVFKGTFDGNGYTISNLKINRADQYVGLFGCTEGSEIKNLTLTNVDVTSTKSTAGYAGGIVGNAKYSTITNCVVSGAITSNCHAGGIAGNSNSSTITNCNVSSGTIIADVYAGGIAGTVNSSSTITNCNVSGTVTSTRSTSAGAGGIAGQVTSSASSASSIKDCSVYSKITANGDSGGVVGILTGAGFTLENVNVYSSDTSKLKTHFIGMLDSAFTIRNSSYNAALKDLPDYFMNYKSQNSTGATAVNIVTPINAWSNPASTKVINLTDADGKSLGITTGTFTINKDGVQQAYTIGSTTTLSQLMNMLGSQATQNSDGSIKLTLSGVTAISDGTSNVITKLFSDSKLTGQTVNTQSSTLSYTENNTTTTDPVTHTYDVGGDTKLDDISSNTLPDKWVLNLVDRDGNNTSKTIDISSIETFNSLIDKLNTIDGINAFMQNGNKFIIAADPSKYSSVNLPSDMSNYFQMSALTLGDSDGIQISSKELKLKKMIEGGPTSVSTACYVAMSAKLKDLNISSGSVSIYRNGLRKVIDIDENETLNDLSSKINTAFGDVKLEVKEGKLAVYSSSGAEVFVGSGLDSSNFTSICGFEKDTSTNGVIASRPMYNVNENSILVQSGLFSGGTIKEGTFIIGAQEFTINDKTTLADLISQINYSDKAQATAVWDSMNGQLILTSKVTGSSYINIEAGSSNFTDILGFTSVESGVAKLNLAAQELGHNAEFTINGTNFTSVSNTIDSSISRIQGVTIDLKNVTDEGEKVTLTVKKDESVASDVLSEIVDSYNTLIDNIDKEVKREGRLQNQTTLKLIRNQIRSLMTSSHINSGAFNNLSKIGIELEAAKNGNIATDNINNLYFDKDKFEKAFMYDSESIKQLLVGTETNLGIFSRVENVLDSALKSVTGYFDTASNSYKKRINNVDDKISKLDAAAIRYQARLEKKFKAMDLLISKMQNQYSSFLAA